MRKRANLSAGRCVGAGQSGSKNSQNRAHDGDKSYGISQEPDQQSTQNSPERKGNSTRQQSGVPNQATGENHGGRKQCAGARQHLARESWWKNKSAGSSTGC